MPLRVRRRTLRSMALRSANGFLPNVVTIEHKQVKRTGGRPTVIGAAVQCFKVRHAVRAKPNNFGVKNSRAVNPCRVTGNQRVAFRPISAVDRVEPHATIANMDLQPIAVVLQLVRPAWPCRRLLGDDRTTRMDESSGRV